MLSLVSFHSTGHFSTDVSGNDFRQDIETVLVLVGLRHLVMMRQQSFKTESTCRACAERDQTGLHIQQLRNTRQVQMF